MPKRKRDDELTRDTPVKIDLPFDEAARRLVRPREDDQATSDDAEGSDDDSR